MDCERYGRNRFPETQRVTEDRFNTSPDSAPMITLQASTNRSAAAYQRACYFIHSSKETSTRNMYCRLYVQVAVTYFRWHQGKRTEPSQVQLRDGQWPRQHRQPPADGRQSGQTAPPADGRQSGQTALPADGRQSGQTAPPADGRQSGQTAPPADGRRPTIETDSIASRRPTIGTDSTASRRPTADNRDRQHRQPTADG